MQNLFFNIFCLILVGAVGSQLVLVEDLHEDCGSNWRQRGVGLGLSVFIFNNVV